ncbi:hypothetical protein ABE82_26350 (plasmid) [Paenibacillus peoriae]|uniref:hypothetical protein n=1 Tax=Paenibacillus peoriae TaxID=59893 RepID=UPI00072217AD|nr:hypothetical protein [Paenibacillus peoriae]ALS09939.1 hypothetical protein ABE82_26350 [Paenibacillus peoriae]
MKAKKLEDLSNQELIDEYGYMAVKEATRVPDQNGRGFKEFERTLQRTQSLRIEILSRMGEPKESISTYAWEQETWASKVKYSKLLREHLNYCETRYQRALTLAEAIQESVDLLKTFNEVGHANFNLMHGEDADSNKIARKEASIIRSFLRKYTR